MKMQRTKLFGTLLLALMMVVGSSCNKENGGGGSNNEESGKPKLETAAVRDITDTDAKGGGTILDDGGSDIIGRGICWGKYPTPTVDSSHIAAVGTEESFTCLMANLTPSTTYYVRAYAINDKGVGYGNEVSFQTDAETNKPKLETSMASEITETSAVTGGVIINDGGSDIFERGVCWSTNQNPGVSDSHITAGTGAGSFTCEITELEESTTYYVRAYAINGNGIGYGPEISFTTHGRPKVTTAAVTDITQTSAVCGGTVTDECGSPVDERGVCWSTSHNPLVYDDNMIIGNGMGNYSANMTQLIPNTTYYVRAYAYNDSGIGYGEEVSFTTLAPPPAPTGAINGVFSVSTTQKVYFSQGNLQYQPSTGTWRFATNQYDLLIKTEDLTNTYVNGIANDIRYADVSSYYTSTYNGWIDLFGWGTSGWNNGNVYYHPYDTDKTGNSSQGCGYGPVIGTNYILNLNEADGCENADWGVYNAISNGGNQTGLWRTLTSEEWNFIFNDRNTVSGKRYAKAKVNNVSGVILLPDTWDASVYSLNNSNMGNAAFNDNSISASVWVNTFEANGAVFLPASGQRTRILNHTDWDEYTDIGPGVQFVGSLGVYWSSSTTNGPMGLAAYGVAFGNASVYAMVDENFLFSSNSDERYCGNCVRLVCPVE